MADVKITRIEQATRFDEEGNPVDVYVLKFMVDDSGPFSVECPVEGYTASKGRDAVNFKAQEISTTLGA